MNHGFRVGKIGLRGALSVLGVSALAASAAPAKEATQAVASAPRTAIAATGPAINWHDPPQGVFEDDWYAVMINGKHCGYSRIATKRAGQTIESLNFIELSIQRGAVGIKMTMKSKHQETLTGKPLGFEAEQKMSLVSLKMKGVVRDGRMYITTTQQGRTTKSDYAWDPKGKMAWATALAMRDEPLKVGKTFDLWVYDALAQPAKPIRTKTRVLGKKTIDLFGRQVEAFEAETTTHLMVPVTSVSYVDESGASLKMTMDLGIIKAELIACSEEAARRRGTPPELFVQTFVELGRALGAEDLRRIRYRLRVSDEINDDMFPTTGMQKTIRRSGREVVLEVTRTDWSKLAEAKTVPVPDDVRACLKASTFLNAKDPVIIKLARKAVGKETNPVKMAGLLRRYATDFVSTKDLSVGLATAGEVARSRQGDCTEHAVLLAAMARAVGIPARCVGGMVFVSHMAGRDNVFGFHMWTQVWIAGQWVDLDAALHQTDCDPSHIAMTLMPLNDEGMTDIAVGLLPFIGKTRIEILETEKKGK